MQSGQHFWLLTGELRPRSILDLTHATSAIHPVIQQRPLCSSHRPTKPIGLGLISHFCNRQPDTSLRCEFPGYGLVNRGNVSVVAAAQSCSSFLPARGGMTRLSRPRAPVCKFVDHWNYALTKVSATRFEPWTVRSGIWRSTTGPPRYSIE